MSKFRNYRQVYREYWGSIPRGFHVHHIVPKSEGGSDEIKNLIALHPDDHISIHLNRGDKKSASGVWVMRNGHSIETRKKISDKAKVFNLGNTNKLGKKESEHTRKKKSAYHTGRVRPEHGSTMRRRLTCLTCRKEVAWSVFTRDHINKPCK